MYLFRNIHFYVLVGGKAMGGLEGAIRVPGIIRWPEKIKPGSVSNIPTSLLDFMPTVLEIIGESNQKEVIIIDYFCIVLF